MKDRIEKNIHRIQELADDLVEIYHKRAGQREQEKVDRIHDEIKIRTVLDKIYTKRELSESNLLSLHKCIFEFNNNNSNYEDIYDAYEKCLLSNSYDMYENEINQIIESKNNVSEQKNIFSKIRKKVVNSHGR